MNLDKLAAWFDGIEYGLSNKQNIIAKDILKEIRERLTVSTGCWLNLSYA